METEHQPMTAIILAGGKSSRMKENKALLKVGNQKLIEKVIQNVKPYFQEILISAQEPGMFDFLPYRVVLDKQTGQGPIMGILTGLKASSNQLNFVIGCDIPEIHYPFLLKLMGYAGHYDVVVPVAGEDKYEPLFAFYGKSTVPCIENLLAQNQRKIIKLYPMCRTKIVPFENDGWYRNLNTISDYRNYLAKEK